MRHNVEECDLSLEDWHTIVDAVKALRFFDRLMRKLGGKTAMLSVVLSSAIALGKRLGGLWLQLATEAGWALASWLQAGVEKRLIEPLRQKPAAILACLLDPRVREGAVPVDELPRWREHLVQAVRKVQAERLGGQAWESRRAPVCSASPTSSGRNSPVASVSGGPRSAFLEASHEVCQEALSNMELEVFGFSDTSTKQQKPTSPDRAEQSVLQYLAGEVRGEDMVSSEFWAKNHQIWLDLEALAQKYLTAPPTSVQSERVFSMAGDMVTCHGSHMGGWLVEQLVFLKVNLSLLGFPQLPLGDESKGEQTRPPHSSRG
uniref:HAT C-terminal dimerisation domain-containing protein n=1 Tax=Salvator merianae TaxID=96440 RepID=A0A8D0C663_SALMN